MDRGARFVAAVVEAGADRRVRPDRLSDAERVDTLVGLERLKAWADAQQARLLATMSAGNEIARDLVAVEVGVALRLPPATVNGRIFTARELTHRLPAALAELDAGLISYRHAVVLAEAVAPLSDELATRVQARVLPRAREQSVAAFRRSVHRAVLALDPRGADERHRDAAAQRRVCARPVGDGMGVLWAYLPLPGLAQLMTAVDAAASPPAADDERSSDQRRADALVALATGALSDAPLPRQHGRRPAIQVTVSAETLLGLADEPGELDGYGPIPATLARELAADPTGTWRRLLTDPQGRLLDYGRTVYRPPQPLAQHVIARDRTCRFPGCSRGAQRCDIDHQTPYPRGRTAADNLECLCEHHHRLKDELGWQVTGDPAGTLTWTSPTGHIYRSPPRGYG
jgi:hypothetical protein